MTNGALCEQRVTTLAESALDLIVCVLDKDISLRQNPEGHLDIEPSLWLTDSQYITGLGFRNGLFGQFLIHRIVHPSKPFLSNVKQECCVRSCKKPYRSLDDIDFSLPFSPLAQILKL